MSRLLAELGIGVAGVALIVDAHLVTPGQTVDTRLEIEGGARDQHVDGLTYGVATTVEDGGDERFVEFERASIAEPFSVAAGTTETIETTITVPVGTPTTIVGETPVWVTAGVDVDWAPDPEERTSLVVGMPAFLETAVDTLEGESFVCLDATCRSADMLPVEHRYAFLQVFEFHPRGGHYDTDIGALWLVPTYSPEDPERIQLVVIRDVRSGRSSLDNLGSRGIERTRIELTPETDAVTIRERLVEALDDLVY